MDADLSDKDNLIVVANEDILITPTVEGIEIIEFELAGDITDSDNTLNVDLTKISNFQEIIFSRDTTDPILKSLSVTGASKSSLLRGLIQSSQLPSQMPTYHWSLTKIQQSPSTVQQKIYTLMAVESH